MNKNLICTLAVLLLIPMLAACGGTPSTDADADTTVSTTTPTETETVSNDALEEIMLADDENCVVKITSIDPDNIWGYTLNVYLENKTSRELMFSVDDASVNGFMCDPFWASSVAPGMKANEEISFSHSDFEKNGITDVTDITFTLKVYDANDWMADDLLNETFTINP